MKHQLTAVKSVLALFFIAQSGHSQRFGGGRGPQTVGLTQDTLDGGEEATGPQDASPVDSSFNQQQAGGVGVGQRFRLQQQLRQRPQFVPSEAGADSQPVGDAADGGQPARRPVFAGSRGPQFNRERQPAADVQSNAEFTGTRTELGSRNRQAASQQPSSGETPQRTPGRRPQQSSPFSRRPPQATFSGEDIPDAPPAEADLPADEVSAVRNSGGPPPRRTRPTLAAPRTTTTTTTERPAGVDGEFVSECPISDGFFADAYECDRYYECRGNKITEHLCKDGTVFNDYSVKFGRCDFPFNVDCTDRPNLQPPQSSPNCPRANGYFAHPDPKKCTEFFFCTDGLANPIACPGGLIFDPKKGQCAWPEDAKRQGCEAEDLFEFTCPKQSLEIASGQKQQHPRFPDSTDCQFFYLCIDGVTPRRNGCPLGKVFNDVNGLCDDPINVPDCADWYKDDPRVTTTTKRPTTASSVNINRGGPLRRRRPVGENRTARKLPAAEAGVVEQKPSVEDLSKAEIDLRQSEVA